MGQWLLRFPCAVLLFASALGGSQVASGAEHNIRIVSDHENLRMMFVPKYLEIEPGDRVTWINEIEEEHNVITFPDGYPRGADAFQSPIMTRAGERYSHQFKVPGTYEYHCMPHLPMGMHGLIVVGRASAHDEFHEPSAEEVTAYKNLMMEWFDSDDIEMLQNEERASVTDREFAGYICKGQIPAALTR